MWNGSKCEADPGASKKTIFAESILRSIQALFPLTSFMPAKQIQIFSWLSAFKICLLLYTVRYFSLWLATQFLIQVVLYTQKFNPVLMHWLMQKVMYIRDIHKTISY